MKRKDLDKVQPAPAAIASPLSVANLLKAFRTRWILAVSVGLVLFALSAATVGYFVPATYTAYALLGIRESAERSSENTPVDLIKSTSILQAALKRPGVAELNLIRSHIDPIAWLAANLKVAFLGDTDILRVSLDGTEPKELAILVNAVNESYLQEVNGVRKTKLPLGHEGREHAKVDVRSSKQRANVLNTAEVPMTKNLFEKVRLVGSVGVMGLLFGLFSVSFVEVLSHSVRSKKNNEQPKQPAGRTGKVAVERPSQVRAA